MPGKSVRMLFIGNSFTTKNDLPTLLSTIAQAGKGITIESKVISAGGASLRRHWNAGMTEAGSKAAKRRYGREANDVCPTCQGRGTVLS